MQKEILNVRLSRTMNGEVMRGNVGFIRGDTFIANRQSGGIKWHGHFYEKRQGYPFSVSLINELKNKGIKKIRIIEHKRDGSSSIYEAYVHDFDHIEPFRENGQDTQVCLPLRRWKMII